MTTGASPTPPSTAKTPDNEEPERVDEESVPSDGRDELGEKMIEDLGRDLPKE